MRLTSRIMSSTRRIFSISDLHVDFKENLDMVKSWPRQKYQHDVLIVAGDVTDIMSLLKDTLSQLAQIFYKVFYVPGNHELWLRRKEEYKNSCFKFHEILKMCDSIGVSTKPEKVKVSPEQEIWICPLFSWYSSPDDDRQHSLYMAPNNPKADTNARDMWMDNFMCEWPDMEVTRSEFFLHINKQNLPKSFDAPVITFSHFLPRQDLIFANDAEKKELEVEQKRLGKDVSNGEKTAVLFNFTMYAGCTRIEEQIREIKPIIHVHGHQHRQRDREVDGIRYVSHCLGQKKERDAGFMWGIYYWGGPKQIWP